MVDGRPTEQKFIQVLDNDSADALLSKENSLFGRIKRAIVGVPVYDGHPDLKDHAPETLCNAGRKNTIGVVNKVRKGARGIEGRFSLTPEGAAAVANGSKYPSALWLVQPDGRRGDAILAKPFKLLSVGLTAYPNISGVESLANAKGAGFSPTHTPAPGEEIQKEPAMNKLIQAWLLAQGITLANEATDQQVLEALQKHVTGKTGEVTALGNEKSTLAGKITTLESNVTALTNEKTALANEVTGLKAQVTALGNENTGLRKCRATAVVDLVIQKGKLPVAKRDETIAALANAKGGVIKVDGKDVTQTDEQAFEAQAEKLLGAANIIRLPTDTQSGKVLANELPVSDLRKAHLTAMEEHMEKTGEMDVVKAHEAVKAANPAMKAAFDCAVGAK
jgi:hypothetical protein